MEFRAGTTRAGFPHHPKIVFFSARNHMNGWIKSCLLENFRPQIMSLLVKICRVSNTWLINSGIETLRGEFPYIYQKFPRPFDGFFFKVVAKRPITQHLEKSMVVGVQPNIF